MTPLERKCAVCADGVMVLGSSTDHELGLRVGFVPVGEVSQGRVLVYTCACGETIELLDGTRRGWFIYSLIVSVVLLAFGAWLRDAMGAFLVLLGAGLLVGFGWAVAADGLKRRRHPAID